MRAVCVREPGGVEVLEMREVPEPVPGPGEIRVAVKASAVNRADLLQRRGQYPAPPDSPQDIPGLEFAGEVEICGPNSKRFKPGDRVMGIVGGGGYAEKLVIHERAAVRVPAGLNWAQAASIPEAFFTAFDALMLQAELKPGERLLIHAAGSGVGTAAIQLAKLISATVVGTARSADKLERAKVLGLDAGLVVSGPKFADAAKRQVGGAGFDVILDLVGGDYLEDNIRALAPLGRSIVVGLVAGSTAPLSLGLLLAKRLTLRGTALRTRPIEEKISVAQAFERQVVPHFESGRLKPVLDAAIPMAEVRSAHERMEANATFGKLALVW